MSAHPPLIGDWYCLRGGQLFEVVAVDEATGSVEMQYFDGTLEEMDIEDWRSQTGSGDIEEVEPPGDLSGSEDVDRDEDPPTNNRDIDDDRRLQAIGPDGLDQFE